MDIYSRCLKHSLLNIKKGKDMSTFTEEYFVNMVNSRLVLEGANKTIAFGDTVKILLPNGNIMSGEVFTINYGSIGITDFNGIDYKFNYEDIVTIELVQKDSANDKTDSKNYECDDKMVSHPSHYQSKSGLEVIDVIEAFTAELAGIEAVDTGNAIKYILRWKHKNGVQDLKKTMWYIQHLINHLEKENDQK